MLPSSCLFCSSFFPCLGKAKSFLTENPVLQRSGLRRGLSTWLRVARCLQKTLHGNQVAFLEFIRNVPTCLLVRPQKTERDTVDLCCLQDVTLEQKLFYMSRMVKRLCKLRIPSPALPVVKGSSVLQLGCESVFTQNQLHLPLYSLSSIRKWLITLLTLPFQSVEQFWELSISSLSQTWNNYLTTMVELH